MSKEIIDIKEKAIELALHFDSNYYHNLYIIPNASLYRVYVSAESKGTLNFGNCWLNGYYCTITNSYIIEPINFRTNDIKLFVEVFKKLYTTITSIQGLLDAN